MWCKFCGKELSSDLPFCSGCGRKQNTEMMHGHIFKLNERSITLIIVNALLIILFFIPWVNVNAELASGAKAIDYVAGLFGKNLGISTFTSLSPYKLIKVVEFLNPIFNNNDNSFSNSISIPIYSASIASIAASLLGLLGKYRFSVIATSISLLVNIVIAASAFLTIEKLTEFTVGYGIYIAPIVYLVVIYLLFKVTLNEKNRHYLSGQQ